MFELRPSDLPRLHDDDAGRHALPGMRDRRPGCRSGPAAMSQVGDTWQRSPLIAINVVVFLAEMATGSGGLSSTTSDLISDFGLRGARWPTARLPAGPAASSTPASCIAFNMIALTSLGRVLEPLRSARSVS